MPALYRKYRPQNFAQVIGQEPIVRTLKNAVSKGTTAHAYLFSGGRGVGKTSFARILAKAVNCQKPKAGDCCGVCAVCQAIAGNTFFDLVEIDAASNTGVDNVRELIDHARFSPSLGKYKIFIIDEAHMLSRGAFNALLKILEEPPEHAMFILATTEIHKVPATVISRTQRFDFARYSETEIIDYLKQVCAEEKVSIQEGALKIIADRAEGALRDALSILDKVITLGNSISDADVRQLLGVTNAEAFRKIINIIGNKQASEAVRFFDELSSSGADFLLFNKDLLEHLRQILVSKLTTAGAEKFSGKVLPSVPGTDSHHSAQSEMFTLPELLFTIRLFLRSYKEISASPDPELPVLLATLEAIGPGPKPMQSSAPRTAASTNPELVQKFSAFEYIPQISTKVIIAQNEAAPLAEEAVTKVSVMELSDFRLHLPAIIDAIKQVNSPLATLIKNSVLHSVEGNKAVFGVKYLFHKENLENVKNVKIIKQAIEAVTGKRLGVSAQVIKPETQAVVDQAQVLADALRVFGGELVE